jgi:hypothetical protein
MDKIILPINRKFLPKSHSLWKIFDLGIARYYTFCIPTIFYPLISESALEPPSINHEAKSER